MPMKKPPHPGRIVKEDCLEPLRLNVSQGAKALGITRLTLSKLVNEKCGISPYMAIRLEKMGWGTADSWIRMQAAYELAQARRDSDKIIVHPVEASPA